MKNTTAEKRKQIPKGYLIVGIDPHKKKHAAVAITQDFVAKLKYARVWGSGKHDGLMVKRDHILKDGDVVELHL